MTNSFEKMHDLIGDTTNMSYEEYVEKMFKASIKINNKSEKVDLKELIDMKEVTEQLMIEKTINKSIEKATGRKFDGFSIKNGISFNEIDSLSNAANYILENGNNNGEDLKVGVEYNIEFYATATLSSTSAFNDGVGYTKWHAKIKFNSREEIRDNIRFFKVIWRDANQAKKNQKIFQETIKSQFPTKDMNYEYETTEIEDDPSDVYTIDIDYALEALNLKFEDLNSFKDPIGMLTKAWDRVRAEHANEDYDPPYGWHITEKDKSETSVYKAVNKTIYIFGVMKMIGQFLNKDNYLTDILQNSKNMQDFYIKYVEQTEWFNEAVYKICSEMNKPSLESYFYSKEIHSLAWFEGFLQEALYNVEYLDENNEFNYDMYDIDYGICNPNEIRDVIYNACLKQIEHEYSNSLDILNKIYFKVDQQIDVSYHDGIYLDKVTICKGYKNAVYCFADAAARIVVDIVSYCSDIDEDSLNGVTLKEYFMNCLKEQAEKAIDAYYIDY